LLLLLYLCHKSAFQDEEEEEEEQEEECMIMRLSSEVCLPERKTERKKKNAGNFVVVCWSLSVVCRSFERNGNACLFVSFIVQSPGSCRKLSW
jgi:hypothetical protein